MISKTGHSAFRLASYRHEQRLDYEPTQRSVLAYAQVLLGEVEQQMLGQDQTQLEKRARVAKTQAENEQARLARAQVEDEATTVPKSSGHVARPKPKPKAMVESGPEERERGIQTCEFYESPNGCRYGKSCRQMHPEITKGSGRCYECGATTHLRPSCPRKDGPEESPMKRNQRTRRQVGRETSAAETPSQRSLETRPLGPTEQSQTGSLAQPSRPKAPPTVLGPKLSKLSLAKPLGLLDGGATHALRPAVSREEYDLARPLKVGLASGETDLLRMTKEGTLVTLNKETQPILPLGVAIRVLGMSVLWREDRCDIVHPKRGRVRVTLDKGCPEVPRALCLSLIRELEDSLNGRGSGEVGLQAVGGDLESPVTAMLDKAVAASDQNEALRQWVQEAYPEVPNALLQRCVPNGKRDCVEAFGFNRHTRRKVERGRTLLHLFSGTQGWSHESYSYTLNVDKDRGWDLLDDVVYSYLVSSVLKGYIVAIVAGPPCRTWSRLRQINDQGPPPLRAREGEERFGFKGLDSRYEQMVQGDTLLLLRTLVLMELMQAVQRTTGNPPGFVFLEHPADPATYAECRHARSNGHMRESADLIHRPPSIWAWVEVQQWLDRMSLHVARFDQGAMGHEAVKPTQIATTSETLWESVNARLVPLGDLWHVDRGNTMLERVRSSKSHAAWAPKLVEALRTALTRWSKESLCPEYGSSRLAAYEAVVSKVDKLAEWQKHCQQGHLPWRKDCAACLHSASFMRPHRRQKHPVLLNMMADLAGPYPEGEDIEVRKGKYILMVVYPFPLWEKTAPPPDERIPDEWEDDELGEEAAADAFHEPSIEPTSKEREAAAKETAKWETVVDTLKEPYRVVNLVFVEILPNKRPSTVVSGLSRVYARLRCFGFPVYGLFTDCGGEMVNAAVRSWCEARSLLRRTAMPESHASNGRVERLLALVRREARALLSASEQDVNKWPHAVRHAAEQRLRSALALLSFPVKPMLPFWSKVTIRARTWSDKKWSSRAMTGRVATPSADVDGGWVVRVESEKGPRFYVSTLLYLNCQPPPSPPDLTYESLTPSDKGSFPAPIRRHRSKSSAEPPDDEPVPKEPKDSLIGPAPTGRHREKGVPGVSVESGGAVGSAPVPGSAFEAVMGTSLSSVIVRSDVQYGSSVSLLDKTVIQEDVPLLRRVVGRNPDFVPMAPVAGYYATVERVRYCRLSLPQWRAHRDLSPGQVPGLGHLWVDLPPAHLRQSVFSTPSSLIPAALYMSAGRRWEDDPVLIASVPSGIPLPIAHVHDTHSSLTTSGGCYSVYLLSDLYVEEEIVVLLWVERFAERIYEPLPATMPRVSCLSVSHCLPAPSRRTGGGGLSCFGIGKARKVLQEGTSGRKKAGGASGEVVGVEGFCGS